MAGEYLSLQEVADELGKSTQTIRRMIKKGEIKAARIRTPQGFQYAIERGGLAMRGRPTERETATPPTLLIDSPSLDNEEALTSQSLTDYTGALTSQNVQDESDAFLENDFYILEPPPSPRGGLTNGQLMELVQTHHKEKLMLITILERLQAELAEERTFKKRPVSWVKKLWEYLNRP